VNKRHELLSLVLICAVTLITATHRFGYEGYPDSQKYVTMINIILGRESGVFIPTPFIFRILAPLLAAPFALIFSPFVALSIISTISCMGLAVTTFKISMLFTEEEIVGLGVTLATVLTVPYFRYGGVPLVDPLAMFICALIIYHTLIDRDVKTITLLMVLGVLCKELVLFAGLFVLLYRRNVLPFATGAVVTFVLREMLGGISQPLVFHLPYEWTMLHTLNTLGWVLILAPSIIHAWNRNYIVEPSLKLFLILTLSFMPYYLLGVFNAYFGARFTWPLQFAFIGICSVGSTSVYRGLRAILVPRVMRSQPA